MGLPNLVLHVKAGTAYLKSNTLLVQAPYSGYAETIAAVASINTGITTLVVSAQSYVSTRFFSATQLPLIGQCALAGLPIGDVPEAIDNYMTAAEKCGTGGLLDHVIDHLDDLLDNSYSNANAVSLYNHIIADLSTQNIAVDLINAAMGVFISLQNRIMNAIGLLTEIFQCAGAVYDSFNTADMRSIFSRLGIEDGSSDSKKAEERNKSMTSANDHSGETDYTTRLANMRQDIVDNYIVGSRFGFSTTISASAADDSFNDSDNNIGLNVESGDKIFVGGFADGRVNGPFTLTSRPTASKLTTTGALVDESAGASVTFTFNMVTNSNKIKAVAAGDYFEFDPTTAANFQWASFIQSGDKIVTSGFTDGANNGLHTVTGTPTATRVTVTSSLVNEAAGNNVIFDWGMISADTTISASASDDSFVDTASGFFPDLIAGDSFVTSGFSNGANNGTFTLASAPTGRKLLVDETLYNASAGGLVSIKSGFDAEMRGDKEYTDSLLEDIDINTPWTPA